MLQHTNVIICKCSSDQINSDLWRNQCTRQIKNTLRPSAPLCATYWLPANLYFVLTLKALLSDKRMMKSCIEYQWNVTIRFFSCFSFIWHKICYFAFGSTLHKLVSVLWLRSTGYRYVYVVRTENQLTLCFELSESGTTSLQT